MKRIVVGIDGSDGSLTALAWAIQEAATIGADVEAVLAYDFELAWIDVGSDYQGIWMQGHADKARARLHEILGVAVPPDSPVVVRPLVVEGRPATVLVEVAKNADLLVVGTRGRGGFAGLLLGSVSQRCAEQSSCPVVVVPPAA
jgi:nucleotide-binding universal stress UspA family protein